MILAEELTKWFDDFLAVDRVSLEVQAGQVLVLLGQNGAGKTTTVRMLTSILQPSSGHAKVCGYDVVHQADKVRACVGVLTESHGLYGRMRAEEYLEFFASLYHLDGSETRKRIAELLDRFGLAQARKKRLGEFSKGMRQKLALVRAILHNPPVLLLDEPTSAMDPESARMVRDSIQSLRSSGRAILLCTHNLAEAEELADKVAIIHQGRILLNDSLYQVKRDLLGPEEYEAQLAQTLNGWSPCLPQGVVLKAQGDTWLRFQIIDPPMTIPLLLRQMLDDDLPLISFQEVSRTLEQAFLQAVSNLQGDSHVL